MITSTIPYKSFKFPVGEPHVQVTWSGNADITWEFESVGEIVELLLLKDALMRRGCKINRLTIPYVPFGRQDRVMTLGEPLSIAVMCQLINSLEANRVIITDPHSDVTPALLNNCTVIEQHEVFTTCFPISFGMTYLVSPDGGALKKIYKLAKVTSLGVLECSKQRNVSTGEITGVYIPGITKLGGITCVIVDDICDGGRTFVELAKELQARGAKRIILMVTHGFFTKGLQVFDGLIDEIYTRKGRVK